MGLDTAPLGGNRGGRQRRPVSRGRDSISRGGSFDPEQVSHRIAPRQFRPQVVAYKTNEKAGTIVIDTDAAFPLFRPRQRPGASATASASAVRASAGLASHRSAARPNGRPGCRRRRWSSASANAASSAGRMEGGPDNPLGARALYRGRRSTASTARTSRGRSASPSRPAASGCATRTSSTSTTASKRRHQGRRDVAAPPAA